MNPLWQDRAAAQAGETVTVARVSCLPAYVVHVYGSSWLVAFGVVILVSKAHFFHLSHQLQLARMLGRHGRGNRGGYAVV